ncbi:MAG TPA: hypothetical protein VK604_16745 [Bryobacteraceae bacterium]|nr:hypothetical protein [Bryobacteraceae bacterium]
MSAKLLRFAYVCEFLLALVAIFTSWSEVGGQAALDLMYWAWKLGFGLSLAASIVAYTAAIASGDSLWTMRAVRWLAAIGVLMAAIGVVTYYYTQDIELPGDSDESGTVSIREPVGLPLLPFA